MLKSRSVSIKGVPPARNDGDGKNIANLLLLAIPRQEWARLSPSLELVRLKLHQVLHEAGEAIKPVYFLNKRIGFCAHRFAGWKKCGGWINRQRRLCRSARCVRFQNQSASSR